MLKKICTMVFVACIVSSAAACIFDTGGDYKGGGRKTQGFRQIEQDAGDPPDADPPPPDSSPGG